MLHIWANAKCINSLSFPSWCKIPLHLQNKDKEPNGNRLKSLWQWYWHCWSTMFVSARTTIHCTRDWILISDHFVLFYKSFPQMWFPFSLFYIAELGWIIASLYWNGTHPSILLILFRVAEGWRQSQLPLVERKGSPWAGCQSIPGMPYKPPDNTHIYGQFWVTF